MSRPTNLEYIDALRGLAILGVLCVHFFLFGKAPSGVVHLPLNLEAILYEGRFGVALFFVVSAFTLVRSLHSRMATEHLAIRKYFLRRFFRIAPAFYVVILFVFFVKGVGYPGYVNPDQPGLGWVDFLAHLTFTNAFYPYYINDFLGVEWSVATEFCFYALLPLMMFYLLSNISFGSKLMITLGLFVGGFYLYWLIHHGLLHVVYEEVPSAMAELWGYLFIGSQFHVFVVGILAWLLMHKYDLSQYMSKKIAVVILYLGVLSAIVFAYLHSFNATNEFFVFFSLTFWALMSGFLIIFMDVVRPRLYWLEFLGKISFSLYLVHFFIGKISSRWASVWGTIADYSSPDIALSIFIACNAAVSIGVSMLLYKYLEVPGIRFGSFWIKKRYNA